MGPSDLLLRGCRVEWLDPMKQPQQLSFWPDEERVIRLRAPGSEYPWDFHERMQHYLAQCVHPAIAATMAQEDVDREQKAQQRREKELRPPLFEAA